MNWGKGIAIALIAFVGFIVYLATILMSHKVDLVSDDYYQKEIAFESEITATKNANQLEFPIEIEENALHVIVKIPEGDYEAIQLFLRRPNNDKLDRSYVISGTRLFTINKAELEAGQYELAVNYTFEDTPCQQRSELYIQK